ncbi:zinc ABC transporter substrate-binding protein AdcA [Aerococcus agrisoli]|uniref:Zinc ABC transporter substrate-binding protein AdcA n=1 Tax=Aerococcus agrisoli TaxID=2487350 RepID=A0A3N4GE10_9LACT|nr:zinc ABC transporter substrate-binding protein AdcA [Aerococcus agrisoli]RPA61019.1 zinc ABC transporter substrate-binding protein AdcA [Aerococcus agrisoli]
MKKMIQTSAVLFASLALLAACGQSENTADTNGKLQIATTIYPVYEFTKEIVGDAAEVSLLLPAGTEAHDYEPSARAIAQLNEADALIYHNENMETWVADTAASLKDDVNVVKATEGMVLLPGEEDGHDHEAENEAESGSGHEDHSHTYDPHTWVSPHRAIMEVASITDQLKELYPDMADTFQANADAYIDELEALDDAYTESLTNASRTDFVTAHTAFKYLAVDYGLNQIGIAGLTPHAEPSAERLAELADYVKKNDISYIYYEEASSDKLAKTLAEEVGVQTAVLNPLENLTQDAINAGANYISVMEDNLEALQLTTKLPAKNDEASETTATEETEKTVYNGYFKDADVKDRSLADYAGTWQSVYPYLEDGTLDQVFDYKAKLKGDMTAEAYKDYYTTGYQTDVDNINIDGNTIEFINDGQSQKYEYKYVGYEILTYAKGNRGVRYLFESTDPDAGQYKYVQFSDHNIAPVQTGHYHIYWGGESQESLLEEVDHWPTYYPSNMSGIEIAQEMMSH